MLEQRWEKETYPQAWISHKRCQRNKYTHLDIYARCSAFQFSFARGGKRYPIRHLAARRGLGGVPQGRNQFSSKRPLNSAGSAAAFLYPSPLRLYGLCSSPLPLCPSFFLSLAGSPFGVGIRKARDFSIPEAHGHASQISRPSCRSASAESNLGKFGAQCSRAEGVQWRSQLGEKIRGKESESERERGEDLGS